MRLMKTHEQSRDKQERGSRTSQTSTCRRKEGLVGKVPGVAMCKVNGALLHTIAEGIVEGTGSQRSQQHLDY